MPRDSWQARQVSIVYPTRQVSGSLLRASSSILSSMSMGDPSMSMSDPPVPPPEQTLSSSQLELRILSAKLPAAAEAPTTVACFSWALESGSPSFTRTESVRRSLTPTYNHCATFQFDRTKKATISFFKFKRCVIEVMAEPTGWFGGGESELLGRAELKLKPLLDGARWGGELPLCAPRS